MLRWLSDTETFYPTKLKEMYWCKMLGSDDNSLPESLFVCSSVFSVNSLTATNKTPFTTYKPLNILVTSLQTHLGQWGPWTRALRGHGQYSGNTQTHSGWRSVHVYPERHPWEDDDEEGRDVHLDQVVTHLTFEVELHLNAGEFTCRRMI